MDKLENCADCGKKFGFTERIFSKTNGLWICEDCAITQIQENDNKDQKIADLEAKLAESEKRASKNFDAYMRCSKKYTELKQQLAETDKLMQEYLSKCLSLEQQLAEKDQAIESLQEINQSLGQTCNNDAKEIERLREQLSEKEKERHEEWLTGKEWKWECDRLKREQNQTAIAELQKVLKTMEEKQFYKKEDTAYCVHPAQIAEYVLKQIKSLKGEK